MHGWPGYARTVSDIKYLGFYPQMGWFVTNWLELYGEGTAHVSCPPHAAILGGVVGIGGRHYFLRDRQWTPLFVAGRRDGLDVPRGAGSRPGSGISRWCGGRVSNVSLAAGQGLMLEFRNHHISNAGTRGQNLGVNAAMVVVGVHWVLR